MKKIVTPKEMLAIDRQTIDEFGISGKTLMDRAGKAVFDFLNGQFTGLKKMKIVILCGNGNNGGDGLVTANYLKKFGCRPSVFTVLKKISLKPEPRALVKILEKKGIRIGFAVSAGVLQKLKPDIIIDALLGTGSHGDLKPEFSDLIRWANFCRDAYATYILAIDIPSGLHGESGKAMGSHVIRANETITIGLPKTGLLFGDGKAFTGRLHVADIGFPERLLKGGDLNFVEGTDIKPFLKDRPIHSHKYHFGKALLIAGSKGMSGAALLAARAIMRTGAGLLKVACPSGIAHVIETGLPEAMTIHLPESQNGSMSLSALDVLSRELEWADVLAIGPGLGSSQETHQVIRQVVLSAETPVILDADGLNAFSGQLTQLEQAPAPIILTPHWGEFNRLINPDITLSADEKLNVLRSTQSGKVILLKGSPTLIKKGREIFVVSEGNPGMATAGCGDVLTGIIAGLVAQRIKPFEAAYVGAYLHGLSGDIAREQLGEISLLASDVIHYLPLAITSLK